MSWGTSPTFTTGDIITAAKLNTYRDNLNETAPAKAAAAGELFYATAAHAIEALAPDTDGAVLTLVDGLPAWGSVPGGVTAEVLCEGGGGFPHNGGSSTDVTIATNTTWTTADYPRRVVKLRRLTIAAGVTLTLGSPNTGPWLVFLDELEFGDASAKLSLNGQGAAAVTVTNGSASATSGAGGGMLLLVARAITGANGTIAANGGNGTRNTNNAGTMNGDAGNGCFATPGLQTAASAPTRYTIPVFVGLLADGAGSSNQGGAKGQGGGGGPTFAAAGGGSGTGGGGSVTTSGSGSTGSAGATSRAALLLAIMFGCRGGGSGAALVSTTGTDSVGGGGGGGGVYMMARTYAATPTVTVSGGTGVSASGTPHGGAGVSYMDTIAA